MRMRDLEQASGLPRSAIHYYFREGLLPPPTKTARNAAVYSEAHVQRLRALARLRAEGRRLPLPLLRRAVELMDRGVEPEVAIELEAAVGGGAGTSSHSDRGPMSAKKLARASGVPARFVSRLVEARLLVPLPGKRPCFDGTDVPLARALFALAEATGLDPGEATPISDGVRDVSRHEMSLRNRAVTALRDNEAAALTLRFQQTVNRLHGYLFYRWRLHDIAALRERERTKEANDV